MNKKVIVIGAGGLAKIVIDIVETNKDKIVGVIDDKQEGYFLEKYKILGKTQDIEKFNKAKISFIIAIGNNETRKEIYDKYKNITYYKAIHKQATICSNVKIGEGTIVCAGTIINTCTSVGKNVLIDSNVTIEHDVKIKDFSNIETAACIQSNSIINKNCVVKANTTVERNEIVGEEQNSETPLVSIIIPVFNARKYIEETLASIKNQTYNNYEVIMVDDRSTDDSIKVIEPYLCSNISLIKSSKNNGPAIARNIGIDKAQGRFICYIDADDLWKDIKLEKQVEFMLENDIAFSYTSYEFADSKGISNGKKVIVPDEITYKKALKNTTISTITVMFDMNKLDKEVIKMPNLKYGEDTATWWKILKTGIKAKGISEVLSYYRRTNISLSSNKIKTLKKVWNLYRSVEGLNVISSAYYFCIRNIRAVLRRI